MLNLPLNTQRSHSRSQRAGNGAWFWLMTDARYIALPLISRYHCLDPTNRDILGLHCTQCFASYFMCPGNIFGRRDNFIFRICIPWTKQFSVWFYQQLSIWKKQGKSEGFDSCDRNKNSKLRMLCLEYIVWYGQFVTNWCDFIEMPFYCHWWVSWGRCWNAMPTPSSTMPVARQLHSRLRQCGAKSTRRAPTWDPSMLSGCGRRRNLARLLACVGVSMAGSPAGASSKGRLLSHSSLSRGGSRRPPVIKDWSPRSRLPGWRHFRTGLDLTWRCFWVKVTDEPAILSACLMVRTRFWRTLGSGLSTWEPSNGAVLTVDRTWGWNPKFFSKASRRSNWRLDAAAKPADTAETWASWSMANFSLRSFVRSSLGESSSITDATMKSAREA